MAQERRTAVVEGLLDGRYSVVIATNVLGRGVDLSNVRQVHNYTTCTSMMSMIKYSLLTRVSYRLLGLVGEWEGLAGVCTCTCIMQLKDPIG